jgi:hypothetical protein
MYSEGCEKIGKPQDIWKQEKLPHEHYKMKSKTRRGFSNYKILYDLMENVCFA